MHYLQSHIFPKELSMLSIGEALVKATEMSQTHTSSIMKTNFQEFQSSRTSKQSKSNSSNRKHTLWGD